jgi:hypothetical protein
VRNNEDVQVEVPRRAVINKVAIKVTHHYLIKIIIKISRIPGDEPAV